jgi:hypothetical protein
MYQIQEEEQRIVVKKEKVIREFRDELKLKGNENRELYDEPFFKILNHIYQYRPINITCHIKSGWLTFLMRFEHKFIYIAWSKEMVILNVTIPNDFEKSGMYTLSLDDTFKKLNTVCKKKT